jgi:hypothetical protein
MTVNIDPQNVATVEVTDAGTVVVTDATRDVVEVVTAGPAGAAGAQGEPGPGVPTGGNPGNVLLKSGYANYESEWSAVVDGGTFA